MSSAPRMSSFSNLYITSPMSQLILQPFCHFTYVTAHSPTLLLPHLCSRSFSNPSFASPTSQALHLNHLASRPCSIPSVNLLIKMYPVKQLTIQLANYKSFRSKFARLAPSDQAAYLAPSISEAKALSDRIL